MSQSKLRGLVGLVLLLAIVAMVAAKAGRLGGTALVATVGWAASVWLTDKYVNKYPGRHVSYLLASHLKAAISMVAVVSAAWLFVPAGAVPFTAVWVACAGFTVADAMISLLWRTGLSSDDPWLDAPPAAPRPPGGPRDNRWMAGARADVKAVALQGAVGLAQNATALGLLRANGLGDPGAFGVLDVHSRRLNDCRRLGRFLVAAAGIMPPGGNLLACYTALDDDQDRPRARSHGIGHRLLAGLRFLLHRAFPKIPVANAIYFAFTRGRNRVLSRTEVWGRLQACGLRPVAEIGAPGLRYVLARKLSERCADRKPSYYPIIALERVSIGGRIIRAHKVRTMYPFSEFLQKDVFEANSLGTTGKFAHDYRITEYGRFLRKYWLDELPQLFDWWRGDIKLVGLRAMSRHYFSLYPPDFKQLYLRVKPGLVPPIFGETTGGFQEIVDVERRYLEDYLRNPVGTDIRYLLTTLNDIVLKGVRSH